MGRMRTRSPKPWMPAGAGMTVVGSGMTVLSYGVVPAAVVRNT